jgi:hypothetical protein
LYNVTRLTPARLAIDDIDNAGKPPSATSSTAASRIAARAWSLRGRPGPRDPAGLVGPVFFTIAFS